jgi:hypothetical protein
MRHVSLILIIVGHHLPQSGIDNTNSKNLELYSVLAEYDNAGFPLSYCLLSTASAIPIGKRTKALTAWAICLRDRYNVIPTFTHVDKDMAEIAMLRQVWNPKIQLCWWHLRKAVRERLSKTKLTTTPYNVRQACCEVAVIDPAFTPPGAADPNEYEGIPADIPVTTNPHLSPNTITIRITKPPSIPNNNTSLEDAAEESTAHILSDRLNVESAPSTEKSSKLTITLPARGHNPDVNPHSAPETATTRTFCPLEHRDPILIIMERHFCAHPLIPGYSHPSAQGIREWAVKQIYAYCVKHDLREAWAYLWENWYRINRWKLWARSMHPEIPRLKTTMLLESQ